MLEHENEIDLLRNENEQLKEKQLQYENELAEMKEELEQDKIHENMHAKLNSSKSFH